MKPRRESEVLFSGATLAKNAHLSAGLSLDAFDSCWLPSTHAVQLREDSGGWHFRLLLHVQLLKVVVGKVRWVCFAVHGRQDDFKEGCDMIWWGTHVFIELTFAAVRSEQSKGLPIYPRFAHFVGGSPKIVQPIHGLAVQSSDLWFAWDNPQIVRISTLCMA